MKKIIFACLLILTCLSCSKKDRGQTGCPAKICTDVFISIPIQFVDKQGQAVAIKDFQLVNLRTHSSYIAGQIPEPCCGFIAVADDSNKALFSTEGDDVQVTATSTITNQTKTAIVKIAGGCACHVFKVSGSAQIVFD